MKKHLYILLLLILFFAPLASKAVQKTFYFTNSDSVQLYVRMAGEGKPCLFIHGGPALGPSISTPSAAMWWSRT
jgi:proline iminopeptidase